MRSLLFNITYSMKVLARNKIYTSISILIISLGTLATMILYTFLSSTFLTPKAVLPELGEKISVLQLRTNLGESALFSENDLRAIQNLLGEGDTILPIADLMATVSSDYRSEDVQLIGFEIDQQMISIPLEKGALWSDSERRECVISYRLSQKLFRSANVVGKKISINGYPYVISGVSKSGGLRFLNFNFHSSEVLLPKGQLKTVLGQSKTLYRMFLIDFYADEEQKAKMIYNLVTEEMLPKRNIFHQKLLPITLLNDLVEKSHTDTNNERRLLLAIVSFGFIIILLMQLNLSYVFNHNRIKNLGIQLLIKEDRYLLFKQIIIQNLVLAFLGLGMVFPLSFVCDPLSRAMGVRVMINWIFFKNRVIFILLLVSFIVSIYTVTRLKKTKLLQIVNRSG